MVGKLVGSGRWVLADLSLLPLALSPGDPLAIANLLVSLASRLPYPHDPFCTEPIIANQHRSRLTSRSPESKSDILVPSLRLGVDLSSTYRFRFQFQFQQQSQVENPSRSRWT